MGCDGIIPAELQSKLDQLGRSFPHNTLRDASFALSMIRLTDTIGDSSWIPHGGLTQRRMQLDIRRRQRTLCHIQTGWLRPQERRRWVHGACPFVSPSLAHPSGLADLKPQKAASFGRLALAPPFSLFPTDNPLHPLRQSSSTSLACFRHRCANPLSFCHYVAMRATLVLAFFIFSSSCTPRP